MTGLTRPGELGELASEAIADMIARATGGDPVTAYAESEPPLTWAAISEGGWDLAGSDEDATLRDLAEIARVWGRACLPLPLIPSLIAKRNSPVAAQVEGAVTFAVPSGTRREGGLIPYGQLDVVVATALGGADDRVVAVPDGESDGFDLLLRASHSPFVTSFSPTAARETAVLFAAEAAGAAARLLDDGIAFVKEREQFGRPVGSFQAVKHHLANALIHSEQAETAVIWASLHEEEAFRGALFAIDHSIAVGELVLQVHGGMGFTWELGLHFFLRRMVTAIELVNGLAAAHA